MSGGDGKGHNSGAHSTGGVNGGPTGLGGGGSHGGGVGSGEGAFKVASQRSEGGWLNSYNAAGQLIGSTRQSGNGSGNSGNGGGSANNDAEKARLAAEEAKRQAEEAEIKRKAAEDAAKWDAAHPVEVAERQVNEAQQRMDQALQDKSSAEQRAANHDAVANGLQNEVSPLLKEAQEFRDKFANLAKGGALDPSIPALYHMALTMNAEASRKKQAADQKQASANSERAAAVQSRNEANAASQRLEQMRQEKIKAEAHLNAVRQKVAEDKKAQEENDAVKDAVKFTADFYQTVTEKYGVQSAKIAQELAEAAKGKQLRSVDEALKAFDNYKDVLNKKFSVKDREAIAKALESIDRDLMAKNLAKFSKAFGLVGKAIDGVDVVKEINNGMETGNWRPLLVKLETLAAGRGAASLVAFTFGVMTASPLGILGFGLLMVITSTLINDALIEKINKYVFDL
ncbi:colicin-like pore-forming protein [Yersinia ruckeri]|uniref:Colicin-Ia n=1 Tax=Yersinia ruckeri TaxID=29486 RepID=A0A380QRI8_YERRU|nr:colicin-like pore-forming protein [Yersinia ruckeri]KGA44113.1 colicin pore forming domain protein [Yersinia ruckeri ATCC 29473]MCK8594821.1 colicin-like pore-forming protein [Yersinia ruckeri]MCK8597825.1 colicin-like pore-forming protein [Yersinia ruckeri]MCW6610430.1 colicin-like pore-forming protein [Yersinia ruckeri]MCW6618837.1 colicin-like pore-forming protein [Yersinia ruckeri]